MYKRLSPGMWTHKHQEGEVRDKFKDLRKITECGVKCQSTCDCDGFIWGDQSKICEVLSKVNFCPIQSVTESYYSYHIKNDEASGGKWIIYSINIFSDVLARRHSITPNAIPDWVILQLQNRGRWGKWRWINNFLYLRMQWNTSTQTFNNTWWLTHVTTHLVVSSRAEQLALRY